jgi:predicted dehydrogenase
MVGIGAIGAGSFGLFALQQFLQIENTRLIAIAATHREGADSIAQRFGAAHLDRIEELVNHPEVDLVYISTPPFLHYEQSMLALKAGKHVICEKPLAVSLPQAKEMIDFAQRHGLLMTTNLMQRYNPVFDKIKAIIDEKPLGELLHGYFENYASDENLHPEHWFWDTKKSGGIFIEHGVHFFDILEGWLGEGNVVSSHYNTRPGTAIEEQVQCTVRYGDIVHFNFYHGFTQASRMDRQEMRLLFEKGDITLFEWIPTRVHINAMVSEAETKFLMDTFLGASLDVSEFYPSGEARKIKGRHKQYNVYQKINIRAGYENNKMHIYGDVLKEMFRDQLSWIKDKSHFRKITNQNGYNSLKMAIEAGRLAHING